MAHLPKPQRIMIDNTASKAVNRAIITVTLLSILFIIGSFIALMEAGEGPALTLLGLAIFGFILRALLKGFLAVVEASEIYIARNTITKQE